MSFQPETHSIRDMRPCTTTYPACWGNVNKWIEIVYGFVLGRQGRKKSLVPAGRAQRTKKGRSRETREGWPCWLLKLWWTGTQRKKTNESGPFLVSSLGLSCRYNRFFFCLGFSIVGPVQKYFSSPYTFFPIAQTAGQAAVLARLSLTSVCLWEGPFHLYSLPQFQLSAGITTGSLFSRIASCNLLHIKQKFKCLTISKMLFLITLLKIYYVKP